MTPSAKFETSEYDVLGVSPDASDAEIKSAFHWLIDEQGYRVGVPLQGQWQRARKIRAAYETLGDPVKRRAYDESLAMTSMSWPQSFSEPTVAYPSVNAGEQVQEPELEQEPEPELELDQEQERPKAIHLTLAEVARPDPLPPDSQEEEAWVPDEVADDKERNPARAWGTVLVTILGLGLLIPFIPHEWSERGEISDVSREGPALKPAAPEAKSGEPMRAPPRFQPNFDSRRAAIQPGQQSLPADRKNSAAAEAQPLSVAGVINALSRPSDSASTTSSQQPVPDASPIVAPPSKPAVTPPKPSTRVAETRDDVRAVEPAPRVATVIPTRVGPARAARSSGIIRSPARWIGGGPIDSDNRRGRFGGRVDVRFTVEPNGRVARCVTTRGSGNVALDAMTCNLVEQRARFSPALDDRGQPVASEAAATYVWNRKRRF